MNRQPFSIIPRVGYRFCAALCLSWHGDPMASDRATAKVVLLILALLLATSSRLYTQTIHPIHPSVIFPEETQLTTSQHYLTSVIAVDLDGDGLPDVVAASQLPSTIAWYRNNGDGTFSSQHVISTSLLGPTCIFAADLDGDGRIDIVCSSQTDSQGGPLDNVSVAWFKNAGGAPGDGLFAYDSGNPSANLQTVQAGVASALSVAVLDINGDGLPDIVATNANPDNKIAWYRNSGAGNFGWNFLNPSANQNVISTAGLSPASIAVSDIDGDGLLDFVITSINDNTVAWFKRTLGVGGVPQFTRYVISSNQLRAAACAVGDFDGDGWPDVVCAAPFGNSVTWFRNKTHDASPVAPFFGSPQTITNNARAAFSVAAADLDNDGFPEVIAASLFDNKITWYRNTGAGVFGWNPASPSANERFVSTTNLGAYSVAVADFNQDGSKDVVAGSQDDGKVAVYLNRGGQCALSSFNIAPTSILEGGRDAVLDVAISNRGLPGDDSVRVSSIGLSFEKTVGVPMSTAELGALIKNLYIYADTNGSTGYERGSDTLIATVSNLALASGRLLVPLPASAPSGVAISPGSTRHFFVVPEMARNSSAQNPNSFRITHLSQGTAHTVAVDAISGAGLSVEFAVNPDAPSSFVSARQPHTYSDWAAIHFDATGVPGTSPLESQFGDAVPNVLKYAFAADPLINVGNQALPAMLSQSGSRVFRHLKLSWASDLGYSYEISHDLITWSTAVVNVDYLQTNTDLGNGTIRTDLTLLGSAARSFIRVRLTLAN